MTETDAYLAARHREDIKRVIQFGLALIGGAAVFGSLIGAVYGACRDVVAIAVSDESAVW